MDVGELSDDESALFPLWADNMASEARDARMISITIPLQSQQMAITGPLMEADLERPVSPPPEARPGITTDWERPRLVGLLDLLVWMSSDLAEVIDWRDLGMLGGDGLVSLVAGVEAAGAFL